jgi:hypothetical protein
MAVGTVIAVLVVTDYSVANLAAQPLPANKATGCDVRSLQLLCARLQVQPKLAKILIHKPGPLSDFPNEIPAYLTIAPQLPLKTISGNRFILALAATLAPPSHRPVRRLRRAARLIS